MLEFLLIGGVAVGLGRETDGRWSWTRERARTRLQDGAERLAPWLARIRAALPGILDRCIADVRSLTIDLLGTLDPKTRRVVRERIGALLEPPVRPPGSRTGLSRGGAGAADPRSPAPPSRVPGAASDPPASDVPGDGTRRHDIPGSADEPEAGPAALSAATAALRALQRRYLEGSISLDQYRREARRVRAEPT